MTATDTDSAYAAYRANPAPDTLHGVVKTLAPTINYALASVNAVDDPLVRSKAQIYAAQAVAKYDPVYGANLATHVGHQLRQLTRTARQSRAPVKIPERVQLDSFKLSEAKKSFMDEFGHEPDILELADHTGMPVKHIEKLNRYQFSIPSEEGYGADIEHEGPDFAKDALEYIHHDSDHTDRRILELKLGYGGHAPLNPQEVGAKLKLTPSQLSRRSMRLAKRIHEVQSALETQ
jgi:DNA-directed RNA polymerase specialized sigma subunit